MKRFAMRKLLKTVVAILLIVTLSMNIVPTELLGSLIAYAEEKSEVSRALEANCEDISQLPGLAAGLVAEGLEQTQDGWRFVVLQAQHYAIITGYDGAEPELEAPELLGGADTVAIATGALTGLSGLKKITLPGNVLAIGENAFPRGTVLAGANASYAQKWAGQHGHAFANISELNFCSGVVDFTGIRPENFKRVSANEVWLRALEAKRLAIGTRFFLLDPNNPYQISYYKVTAISEERDGFVGFECETPEVEEVLTYYSAENQTLMIDESSIVLYEGVERVDDPATRSLTGNASASPRFAWHPKYPKLGNYKFDLSFELSQNYSASCEVGLFVSNRVEISETTKFNTVISIEYTHDFLEDKEEDPNKKLNDLIKKWRADKGSSRLHRDRIDVPFAKMTVLSWAGILNLTLTAKTIMEFSGKASASVEVTTTTTMVIEEGKGITKKARVPSQKKATGEVEGELKFGFEFELAVKVFSCTIASIKFFTGADIKAAYSIEENDIGPLRDVTSVYQEYYNNIHLDMPVDVNLDRIVNINMLDCITITFDFVVELSAQLGGSWVTLADASAQFRWNMLTLHYHFLPYVVKLKDFDPNAANEYYTYSFTSADKNNFHADYACPYDLKTVQVILPFDNNRVDSYSIVEPDTPYSKPSVPYGDYFLKSSKTSNGTKEAYKLLDWYTDATMDEALRVKKWPYVISQDTTFYAKTEKMAEVKLLNADGSDFEGNADAFILDSLDDTTYTALRDRSHFIAKNEYIRLPLARKDGTEILYWIRVHSDSDLNPIGFDDYANESQWQIVPGSTYQVKDYWGDDDTVCFCAVTDQDIAVFFHLLTEAPEVIYSRRGGTVPLPTGVSPLPRYDFAGWIDSEGNPVTEAIQLPIDCPTELHYYATWEPNNNVQAEQINDIYVGTKDNGILCTEIIAGLEYAHNNDGENCITIGDYTGTEPDIYIPSLIPQGDVTYKVTRIAPKAFNGNTTLRTIMLPAGLQSIGENAFTNCTHLQMIDMSATRVSEIPANFASGCTSLQCVRLPLTGITQVGNYAFSNCMKLDAVSLNCDIGAYAFTNCVDVTRIRLGGGVTSLGERAFVDCVSLQSLSVPDSVTSIGNNFIKGCTAITELTVNPGCRLLNADQMYIGEGSQLQKLSVGGCVTMLGDEVFANAEYGFPQLTQVTLPPMASIYGKYILRGSAVEELTIAMPMSIGGTLVTVDLSDYVLSGCDSLKTVTILSGAIPNNAFSKNKSLETVYLGPGVTKIGNSAFADCPSLKTVKFGLPNSNECAVSSIGTNAFKNCASLTELSFPASVTSFGSGMLQGCTGLETLSIAGHGDTVLEAGTSSAINPFYIGANAQLKTLILGDGVTEVGANVFANATNKSTATRPGFPTLETVRFGKRLQTIGSYCFANSGVTSIEFAHDVNILEHAFAGCQKLTSVTLSGGVLGSSLFADCPSLTDVTILSGEIPAGAFSNCASLTNLTIEESVTGIGASAFKNCTGLTSLSIPDSVTTYGVGMIEGCTALKTLRIGAGIGESIGPWPSSTSYRPVTNPFYIGAESQLETLELPEGITAIGRYGLSNGKADVAGSGYPNLKNLILPSTLTTVGSNAFKNTPVYNLVFNGSVTLESSAFSGNTSLESVTIPGGTIGANAFYGCTNLKTVTLGEEVTSIGTSAFSGCTSLTSLSIPDSVIQYGMGMINGCASLKSLRIGAGIGKSVGPWPTGGTGINNPLYIGTNQLETLELAEGITTIGEYALANGRQSSGSGYANLKTVILPSTLTKIGNRAFYNTAIYNVIFHGDVTLERSAFEGNTTLESVTIPGGTIGAYAFYGCTNLKTVTLGDEVTSIGTSAFSGCTSLTSLSIPDSVTYYGAGMIQSCTSLKSLRIGTGIGESVGPWPSSTASVSNPFYIDTTNQLETLELAEGIAKVGDYALANGKQYSSGSGYSNLKTLILPSTLVEVGRDAFKNTPVHNLVFNGNVTLESDAFSGNTSLESVTIPGGTIGNYAFIGCTNLKTVILGDEVTSIGASAFKGCTSLTSLSIPDSVTTYGKGIIEGCTALKSLRIGAGIGTSVGPWKSLSDASAASNPFYIGGHGESLETLELAEGITTIGEYALSNDNQSSDGWGYSRLKTLVLPSTLVKVGKFAFKNTPVRNLVFNGNVTLESDAFSGNTSLESVTIPGGTIGSSAFSGCSNLKTVTLGDEVTGIGSYAFSGCTSLTSLSIPDSVTTYGKGIIEGCTALKSLRIGAGIGTSVGPWPSSTNLAEVTNPFYIDKTNQLKTIELAEGITVIAESALSNAVNRNKNYDTGKGYPNLTTLILPSTLTTIGNWNLAKQSSLRTIRLPDGLQSIVDGGTFNPAVTLYTTAYNSVVDAFAQQKKIAYVYDSSAGLPQFKLRLVAKQTAVQTRAVAVSDGTMVVTRGVEGEVAVLAEGYAVLADDEVAFLASVVPEAPTVREGCAFAGWYTDPEFTAPWTMNVMPSADLTLYAKILEPVAVDYVTLDENGEATLFQRFSLLEGSELPVPEAAPEKEHAVFSGWYTDEECLAPVAIKQVPAQGVTLYAGFIQQTRILFAVNLWHAGKTDATLPEGFYLYTEMYQTPNEAFALPADPMVEGYAFEGWFCDPEMELMVVPNLVPPTEKIIYGKLSRMPVGGKYKPVEGGLELVSYRLQDNQDSSLSLPSLVDGQKLVSIGAYAFDDSGVTSVRLPDTVQRIDRNAFGNSTIGSITVSRASTHYATRAGVLYNKDMTELICYPEAMRHANYDMPDTVTRIGESAVANNRWLKTVHFSSALVEIGPSAFSGCRALSRVELPDSVTTLRKGAFSSCDMLRYFSAYGLTTIEGTSLDTLPLNLDMAVFGPLGQGVLRDWCTFQLDNGETYTTNYNQYALTLYVDGALLREISAEAGMTISLLRQMDEDENGNFVQTWYQDSEMTTPWNLDTDLMPARSLTLYATLTKQLAYETVTLEQEGGAVTGLCLTGYRGSAHTLTIPETLDGQPVIAIGSGFGAGLASVNELSIGNHILSVEMDQAPAGCVIICDADSPAHVWALAHGADYQLKTYALTFEATGLDIRPMSAVRNASLFLPTPERGASTFLHWCTDEARTLPVALSEDGLYTMPGYDHTLYAAWLEPDDTAPFEVAVENGTVTITGYTGSESAVVIPQTLLGLPVTAIGDAAFQGARMQSIDLGAVSVIGRYAFADCTSLVSVTLPDLVALVEDYAFSGCVNLRKAELGAGLAFLNTDVFSGCRSLSAVTVSERNEYLSSQDGVLLSKDGSRLLLYPAGKPETAYRIPDGVSIIAARAFADQSRLTSLTVPDSVTLVLDEAFKGCIALSDFTASSVTQIGSGAFFGCANLTTVNAGERLSSVGEFAFGGCSSLQRVYLPAAVTLVAENTYFGYSAVTLVGTTGSSAQAYALANGLFFIDPQAQSVQEITLSEGDVTIGRGYTLQLSATLLPESAAGAAVRWVSSDQAVATVDEQGLVSALGIGTAYIRVYSDNACSAECKVTVVADIPAEAISLEQDALQMSSGDRQPLRATVTPLYTTDLPLKWTSSDESVVTVDARGVVQAVGGGEALITVETINGLSASCAVSVTALVTDITIQEDRHELYLMPGLDSLQLTAVVLPENVAARVPLWRSSDPTIATVDENGHVTALAAGNVIVTATAADDSGVSASYPLTVYEQPVAIQLPAALEQIGEEAFYGDSSLQYVILSERVTVIHARAFANTSRLVAIRIPSSVQQIAEDAFTGSHPLIICAADSAAYRFALAHGLPVWCEE